MRGRKITKTEQEHNIMASVNFNANEVEPSSVYETIPAGKYQAVITESEMKTTKSGTGQYLKLEFEVIEGEYKGRKLWANLNLNNPNQQAVDIARKELSAICHAVNVMQLGDSVELHNLPLTIVVKIATDQYGEPQNIIKGYAARMTGSYPQPAPKQGQNPYASAQPAGRAPWAAK